MHAYYYNYRPSSPTISFSVSCETRRAEHPSVNKKKKKNLASASEETSAAGGERERDNGCSSSSSVISDKRLPALLYQSAYTRGSPVCRAPPSPPRARAASIYFARAGMWRCGRWCTLFSGDKAVLGSWRICCNSDWWGFWGGRGIRFRSVSKIIRFFCRLIVVRECNQAESNMRKTIRCCTIGAVVIK